MWIIKRINEDFPDEWAIYNSWVSADKDELIRLVEKDLSEEVLMDDIKLTLTDDHYLLINGRTNKKWLELSELVEV